MGLVGMGFFYSVFGFVLASVFFLPQDAKGIFAEVSLKEVMAPRFQSVKLVEDGPLSAVYFAKEGGLYAVGRKALWFFDDHKAKIKKIPVSGIEKKEHIVASAKSGSVVALATTSHLFIVDFARELLKQVPLPYDGEAKKAPFFSHLGALKGGFIWAHTTGIYHYDLETSSLTKTLESHPLAQDDRISFRLDGEAAWVLRKDFLLLVPLDGTQKASQILQKGFSPFLDVKVTHEGFLLLAKDSALRLDKSGALMGAVPVRPPRHLLAMAYEDDTHSYLLSDGKVEIYHLGDKKKVYGQLPLFEQPVSKALLYKKEDSLVTLLDGKMRVYSLGSLSSGAISSRPRGGSTMTY